MNDAPAAHAVGAGPRLTRLELQGFKSFATRTLFVFEPGITAVVGPNGSGKSNIADAVRWVLGEQGHATLRTKRGEDVIFAGGHGRAPAGIAEATLTFDNSERWLPIAFAEVTVTRRAFRAGESHYLINGRRVRLKDVAQLTASLGHSHVVVGQGLVDVALSQRAEDRRGLFEHAADLTGLRLKLAEAERGLAEAEVNSARLNDLLTELDPRLRTLERAARQAREWQGIRDQLQSLQRLHFRNLLTAARHSLAIATTTAEREAAALTVAEERVERLTTEHEAAIQSLSSARVALAEHDGRRQTLDERLRRIGHERDLAAERAIALGKRREDMADTQSGLDEQARAVTAETREITLALLGLDAEIATARHEAHTRRSEATAARADHAELERRAALLVKQLGDAERQTSDLARRRALLEQRRETNRAEHERLQGAVVERSARLNRLTDELAQADEAVQTGDVELTRLASRIAELTAEEQQISQAARIATDGFAKIAKELGEATTRLEALRRLQASGAGLHDGVRATLAAARSGQISGVRGTVAELISVPADLETAIDVALGAHVQDILVERWRDAEEAIAHLKRTNAGRATFQPLDTVRAGRGDRSPPREALGLPGVRGIAVDLVDADPALHHVVRALLGRTLVVDNLQTTRVALIHLPMGWSVVTLTGEIARAGGSVTGGAAVRESGVLSRERELRSLPGDIRRLEEEHSAARAALDQSEAQLRRVRVEHGQAETDRAARLAAREQRRREQQRLASWRKELRQEQESAEHRLAELDAAERDAVIALEQLEVEGNTLTLALEAARGEQRSVQREVQQRATQLTVADRMAAEATRRLAALEERLRGERQRELALRARERALAEEVTLRAERAAALDRERETIAATHDRLVTDAAALERARTGMQREREPLEATFRQIGATLATVTRGLEASRSTLLERERVTGAASLAMERAADEVAAIRRRIVEELELDDPDTLAEDGKESVVESDPAREREIARLKERLRRVGYVGEDAVTEFEREAERHAFLHAQLADIEGAASSLRALLRDLAATMRARFDETFQQVAEAFAETFVTLFGGGSARLVLTGQGESEGEDGGIDIVAQPPGKRLQSLALLSGGERALTAVALLFAILRVNPAPFCLLDEVDAALDEANIVRFRDQLRELAGQTQVVVITHNRGTIEIADTLYGISMGDDGISKVLSLRLAEAAAG